MIAPNFIFYFEDKDVKSDSHPLKYKFNKTNTLDCKDLKDNIHLHAASSVFDYKIIKNNKLRFNPDVKPNFEDGKFITDYFLLCMQDQMVFLKSAIYYYRKRSDSSSTLDTAWEKKEKYSNVLKYGYLDVLETYYRKLGGAPTHIQRAVLYDISWYINYLLNSEGKVGFLSEEEKNEFIILLKRIFNFIDYKTIIDFNLAHLWFMKKVGVLGCFKNEKPNFQITYIENIDREKKQILISFFTTLGVDVSYRLNGQDITPQYFKTTQYDFVGKKFVDEKRAWIAYDDLNDKLEVFIDDQNARLSLFAKQHHNGLLIQDIVNKFEPSYQYEADGSWLLMDRNTQADDNAEHLYRYIMQNNLKQDCYFALNKESTDWSRLEREGFKLLDFGSDEFERKLKHCSKIISSHLDKYVNNYFGDEYEYSKKFVFLQHGVTHNDLSNWFKLKKNLQCIITATQPEYSSIANDNNHYKSTKKEVVLTGFPRHDALLSNSVESENLILIMPTWRNNIAGKPVGNGNERAVNDEFNNTLYAQSWFKFLHSQQLKQLVERSNYKVIFAPHANIVPYLDFFSIPSFMDVWSNDQANSMQELFKKSKVMITDYSSVAFEMAYLEKAIIYYQFDKETIYSGGHIYEKGYFEYERDGFGAVVEEVEEVNHALLQVLENDGQPLPEYLERMQQTFTFKDGRCCERVYDAILDLDQEDNAYNVELAQEFLSQASIHQNSRLVVERAEKLLNTDMLSLEDRESTLEKLAESYYQLNDIESLEVLLESYNNKYYEVMLLAKKNEWTNILSLIGADLVADKYFNVRLSCLFNLDLTDSILDFSDTSSLSEYQAVLLNCYVAYTSENWADCLVCINSIEQPLNAVELFTRHDMTYMKLMVAKYLNKLDVAVVKKLVSESKDFTLQKSIILASLNEKNEALKGFALLEQQYGLSYFDLESLSLYIEILVSHKKWQDLLSKLPECLTLYPEELIFSQYYVLSLAKLEHWKELTLFLSNSNINLSSNYLHYAVLAYYRIGEIEQATALLVMPTSDFNYDYWSLALEIYIQNDNEALTKDCLKRMYAIFPEESEEIKSKYLALKGLFGSLII